MTRLLNYRYAMLMEYRRAAIVFTDAPKYARPLDDFVKC